jgi:hypothetical protein
MNCRAFHKNLEDYLQEGLDFSNRFAIERHAQQCISCGKDLADASELRRMVKELTQVKAPADFESSLLDRIGMVKAHSRFSSIRRFWDYGPEWLSWKKLMVASASLAVLVLGVIVSSHQTVLNRPTAAPVIANQVEKTTVRSKPLPAAKEETTLPAPSHAALHARKSSPTPIEPPIKPAIEKEIPKMVAMPASFPSRGSESFTAPRDLAAEYSEFMMSGAEVRPVPVRMLPKKIRIIYRPASEGYFIQNVSH